jgi:phosphatidylglycerophosphate synthase
MADIQNAPDAPPPLSALPNLPATAGWSLGMALAVALLAHWLADLLRLPPAAAMLATVTAALAALTVTVTAARARAWFAPCSRLTLGRAGIAALLTGLLAAPAALARPEIGWGALALALVALALDGADGWMARRRGQESAWGARFDMEADAALILVLSALALAGGKAGAWVLALGLMRYGFVAAGWLRPRLTAELPPSFRRKTVCVLQVAALAALLAPVVEPPVSTALAAVALAFLVWSFAVDVLWLERHGRAGGPA